MSSPRFLASSITSLLLTSGALLTTLVPIATAEQISWEGDVSSDFELADNWQGGLVPMNDLLTDVATFGTVAIPNGVQPSLTASRSVAGLNFQTGGWTVGSVGDFVLSVGLDGIYSLGNNSVSVPINVDNGNPKNFSTAAGTTLTLDRVAAGGGNQSNLTIGSLENTGTVVFQGTSGDNNFLSPTVVAGTLILNKGSIGGTTSVGSAVNNITVDAGAVVAFGENQTDRNDAAEGGRGQIWGTATINGTMDLRGTGVFTDNWGLSGLSGTDFTAVVTNNGTGPAQIRLTGGGGTYAGALNDGTHPTALQVRIDGDSQNFSGFSDFSGGVEILRGQARFMSDESLGAVPPSPSENIVINGPEARLMNYVNTLVVNVNRTIVLGEAGGGLQAGFNQSLIIDSAITGNANLTIFDDNGTVILNGINTYTGDTIVGRTEGGHNGKLSLTEASELRFVIGADGVSNRITSLGGDLGQVTLDGAFRFDLSGASAVDGNMWTIVDVAQIYAAYGNTFSVIGFSDSDQDDIWTLQAADSTWRFTESTGVLDVSVVPEPSSALLLLSAAGFLGFYRAGRRRS